MHTVFDVERRDSDAHNWHPTRPVPLGYNQIFGMSVTTFQDKLMASGARLGSYRGAETPASFGDTAAEFQALLAGHGCV